MIEDVAKKLRKQCDKMLNVMCTKLEMNFIYALGHFEVAFILVDILKL